MARLRTCFLSSLTILSTAAALAQSVPTTLSGQVNRDRIPIPAVPFLTFTPDARSAALGDAGVALSPDANALYWNSARLPFAEKHSGLAASYTPWLSNLGISDMYLGYVSGYKKIANDQIIGLSVNYFDLGQIEFTNDVGVSLGTFFSREYAISGSYARKLSDRIGVGVNLRYINSNLVGNQVINGVAAKPGTSVAGDIAFFYNGDNAERRWNVNYGAVLSNIGGKVSYGGTNSYHLPTNLKLGTALTRRFSEDHRLTFTLDVNKLMVPTPPVYRYDNGQLVRDSNGNPVIDRGRDPYTQSALGGAFGSFTDAPNGFNEELQELTASFGAEYWFKNAFALRAGYFFENPNKGNRQYITTGLGVNYNNLGLDFAYLFQGGGEINPLNNTLRLTLSLKFDKRTRPALLDDEED
jgi:hypothetical protein